MKLLVRVLLGIKTNPSQFIKLEIKLLKKIVRE